MVGVPAVNLMIMVNVKSPGSKFALDLDKMSWKCSTALCEFEFMFKHKRVQLIADDNKPRLGWRNDLYVTEL